MPKPSRWLPPRSRPSRPVFLSGSPLHVYDHSPEVERQLAFMRQVFASGTPSFGSCAGLQIGRSRRRRSGAADLRAPRSGPGAAHRALTARTRSSTAARTASRLGRRDDARRRSGRAAPRRAAPGRKCLGPGPGGRDPSRSWHLLGGAISSLSCRRAKSAPRFGAAPKDFARTGWSTMSPMSMCKPSCSTRLQRSPDDNAARWRLGVNGRICG